jgi:DNA polymerase III delta prime subunit
VIRIIEPLASRCSKFRFKPLDSSSTMQRVQMIAEAESVKIDDGVRTTAFDPLACASTDLNLFRGR